MALHAIYQPQAHTNFGSGSQHKASKLTSSTHGSKTVEDKVNCSMNSDQQTAYTNLKDTVFLSLDFNERLS
jgi:hypothetical protein